MIPSISGPPSLPPEHGLKILGVDEAEALGACHPSPSKSSLRTNALRSYRWLWSASKRQRKELKGWMRELGSRSSEQGPRDGQEVGNQLEEESSSRNPQLRTLPGRGRGAIDGFRAERDGSTAER